MPYFCVACGAFSEHELEDCEICGVKRESPKVIDLVVPRRRSPSDVDHDDEEFVEVISRPKYLWYQITRPWRVRWRRSLLWRVVLTTVASFVIVLPIVGAVDWWSQQRCDTRVDVTCTATVVQLVAPIAPGFAERLGAPITDRELLIAAEIYDAVAMFGIAWSEDGRVSADEIIRVSAGKKNVCTTIEQCARLASQNLNVDYDGVSGSLYLAIDGKRGTYLANRAMNVRSDEAESKGEVRRIAATAASRTAWPLPVSENRILVLGSLDVASRKDAVSLAQSDLRTAGLQLDVTLLTEIPNNLDDLGAFVVVVDDGVPDQVLEDLVAAGKVVIAVGSPWRQTPLFSPWLRISAHTRLLSRVLDNEIRLGGSIQFVGRCDVYSARVFEDLQRDIQVSRPESDLQYQCLEKLLSGDQSLKTFESMDSTLIIATPGNSEPLLRVLLEKGVLSGARDVILLQDLDARRETNTP